METQVTPLTPGEPSGSGGRNGRGPSRKTRFFREQLQNEPGKWFIWRSGSNHASDTGSALRTLTGMDITGLDRATLPYEAISEIQPDGTYTCFVRYVDRGDLVITARDRSRSLHPSRQTA